MGVKVSGYHSKPTNQQPWNTGMAEVVQPVLDQLVARQSRRYQESIRPDHRHIRIWNKIIRGSVPCTCSAYRLPTFQHHEGGTNTDFVGDETNLQPTETSILPENSSPDATFGDLPMKSTYRLRMQDLDVGSEKTDYEDHSDTDSPDSLHGNDETARFQPSDLLERLRTKLAESARVLTGGDFSACAICLGSGFVNGYQLLGGTRVILDFSGSIPYKAKGASIRRETDNGGPWRAELSSDDQTESGTDYIVWFVELPSYFNNISAARVYNNEKQILEGALEVREQSNTTPNPNAWVEMTPTWINARKGQVNKLEIRYRCGRTLIDAVRLISHIEIIIETMPLHIAQFPNFQKDIDYTSATARATIDIEIDPQIGMVNRESILQNVEEGQMWKITSVKEQSTAKGQLVNVSLTGVVVQPGEIANVLSIDSNVRVNFHPFRGLERVQGGKDLV